MSLKAADNFGVIDIGSNTIRGVAYKGGEKPFAVEDKAYSSHILAFTQNGILSGEGIEDLCQAILGIKEFFKKYKAKKIFAFATSAMRDVENFPYVQNEVKEKTDILIELISGEEEAEFDFLAIKSQNPGDEGICVDLGGGSAQVIIFGKKGVKAAKSMPIGAKRVRNMFVEDFIPNGEEKAKIESYIAGELSWIEERCGDIWFMGGTAKAAEKGVKKLFGVKTLTPEFLEELYNTVTSNSVLLMTLFPKRYKTMPAGILAMIEIAKTVGAEKITVTEVGVRDGYVEKMMGEI